MKIQSPISFILGVLLSLLGAWWLTVTRMAVKFIPLFIGFALIYLGWRGGRRANLVFGHILVICGCFLITYGIYLVPRAKPDLAHILGMPLFWGFVVLFGGWCTIYHGFCHCITSRSQDCSR